MMDHYKVLGLNKTASKEEIKIAFKKLAFQFHPDKHSQSSKSVRENATIRFKQVSEAYEVLMDDRKRAEFNYRWRAGGGGGSAGARGSSGAGNYYYQSQYSYGYGRSGSGSGNGSGYYGRSGSGGGFGDKFGVFIRILTARSSLLNLGFAAAILGAMVVVDTSGESLWKMQNSGKSFEEAMNTIEKAKVYKKDNTNEHP